MKRTIQVETSRRPVFQISNIIYKQVVYWGGSSRVSLGMNLLKPWNDPGQTFPLVVWICGGGWLGLDKGAHIAELAYLADQGYVVASVDYRTCNMSAMPGPLEDVKAAIRWLRAHAAEFAIDPTRVAVMGESAGGHLAAMVGLTGNEAGFDTGEHLDQSSAVQTAIIWYGPSDIVNFGANASPDWISPIEAMVGVRNRQDPRFAAASPLCHVRKNAPPFLLLHGTADALVPFSESEKLYDALLAEGNNVDFVAIEGADHADNHFFQPAVRQVIRDYLRQHLD